MTVETGARRFRGPIAAVLLAAAIGLIGQATLPLVRTEGRLRRAAELTSNNPMKGLQSIETSADPGEISRKQLERGRALAHEALRRMCGPGALLKSVGPHVYDAAATSRAQSMIVILPAKSSASAVQLSTQSPSL